jgi:cation diffusion facilitator CzcD-associated flavoprotein CzcO
MTDLIGASDAKQPDPEAVASDWLDVFEASARLGDVDSVLSLFSEDCWWRDILTVTWDLRTMHGLREVRDLAGEQLKSIGFSDFTLDDRLPASLAQGGVTAAFTFQTDVAYGRGLVRLREEDGVWKAWALLTKIEDLIGYPEQHTVFADTLKPKPTTPEGRAEGWYEYRERQREFRHQEPDVVVVGAGHAGLSTAARLQHLGLSSLVLEQTPRVGDVWRDRYRGLTLHTVSFFVQMPYLSYPDNWPVFPPKELIGDWFEAYAWMLQLNVWTSACVESAKYDEDDERWTVDVIRDGERRTVNPRHVVFATGAHSGNPSPPEIPGNETFRGVITHSSVYRGAEDLEGKRVVVVGTGSSGIDIAEDAYEMGADVTLVQRGGTTIMSIENGVKTLHGNLYSETGPGIDEADLISLSSPFNLLLRELAPQIFEHVAQGDAELHEGLKNVGFEVSRGPYGSGHLGQSLLGGGCYIEKGALQLIINGQIKIQRGEIASFTQNGVVFSDGTEAEADLVIFATGFPNMRDTIRPIVGDGLADQLTVVWGLDDEGEINGLYRPSGHPKLWFMGGGFQDSRWGSKFLALQIKATEEGLIKS